MEAPGSCREPNCFAKAGLLKIANLGTWTTLYSFVFLCLILRKVWGPNRYFPVKFAYWTASLLPHPHLGSATYDFYNLSLPIYIFWNKVMPRGQDWTSNGEPPSVIPPELEIHTHSTCPQVILIYTNFCDTCDGTQERSLLLVYKAFEKQLRFLDFAISPQILPWLKMEVPTGAGYKWPTQAISILNHFQNPNKFSRMEICPYPCFGSPGGDTCFAHYDSSSPSLSTEAKRRSVLRSCLAGSAHSTASDHKITPVLSPVRTFE